MNDVTPEQAAWTPPGVANPLGATYAHLLTGEDGFIAAFLKGGAPLMAPAWAGRLGLARPHADGGRALTLMGGPRAATRPLERALG